MYVTLIAVSLVSLFFLGTAVASMVLLVSRVRVRKRRRLRDRLGALLLTADEGTLLKEVTRLGDRGVRFMMRAYARIVDHVELPDESRSRIEGAARSVGAEVTAVRLLNAKSPFRRQEGALILSLLPSAIAPGALDQAIRRERLLRVKLRLVYAVVRRRYVQVIPTVLDSLRGEGPEYGRRVASLLGQLGFDLLQFLPTMRQRSESEIQRVFVALAARTPTAELQAYLRYLVARAERGVARDAYRALVTHFRSPAGEDLGRFGDDPVFRRLAVESIGKRPSEQSVDELIAGLSDEPVAETVVATLSEMVGRNPWLLPVIIERYRSTDNANARMGLARTLAARAEYVVTVALREQWDDAEGLIGDILRTRQANGVLLLLNRSTDTVQRDSITALIGETVRTDPWLRTEYALHADDDVLAGLGIERVTLDHQRGSRKAENPRRWIVATAMLSVTVLPLLIYLGWVAGVRGGISGSTFVSYLSWFLWGFAGYAFVLNTIYLSLLVVAVGCVIRQQQIAALRTNSLLFAPRMLPSISIIAPAYNEQETIVESVTALLNLNYPDFEVIVVNDGSPDGTLQRLVEHFELERTGREITPHLATKTVRGVYGSSRLPGLIVVDKSNGGKADSLNVGINASQKEYFAAIDADSLLEPDALLELAAGMIDSEYPVVAAGGNILPVNGCRVEMGVIEKVGLPRNRLARFQMVEYIRSFMSGRTGWAGIDSLLIISGAFGLFRVKEVVAAHGYLTGSEQYEKDTVAEDMELVVRVRRNRYDRGERGVVQYAAGANCWTEVPETVRIFTAQRDRWQRGLIDILLFHAHMAFRRRYGRVGLIALPYYYLFELLGPWIEVQGYLVLLLGLSAGVVSRDAAIAAAVASIPLGMMVSLVSIQLVEYRRRVFSFRARLAMVWVSLAENLGYRQLASAVRLRAYLSVLRGTTGWGVMRRRGFGKKEQKT